MNNLKPAKFQDSEGEVGLVKPVDFTHTEPFVFDSGKSIPELTLRYETYGHLNTEKTNAILICHALSGDHHCAGLHSIDDKKPGWWNAVIGPGKPIDTNKFYVICSNCLGGCQGSSGPGSTRPDTDKPYGSSFPITTILDMVRAQKLLIDHLGIPSLFAVIGGSMGGMQTLQWSIEYPEKVDRIIVLAATARHSAQAIAFNEVGRASIVRDPDWEKGDYKPGKGPNVGLSIARMMAHITYLSNKGMEDKFGRSKKNTGRTENPFDVEFEVESYLRYQGQSFINRFDANTYLYFTKAVDRFDLYGNVDSLDKAFLNVQAAALVVGFSSDWLYPPEQNRALVHALLQSGKNATYAEISMDLGHDSFLIEAPELYDLIREFLK